MYVGKYLCERFYFLNFENKMTETAMFCCVHFETTVY